MLAEVAEPQPGAASTATATASNQIRVTYETRCGLGGNRLDRTALRFVPVHMVRTSRYMLGQFPDLFGVVDDGIVELFVEGVDFDVEPDVVVPELEVAAFAIAVPPATNAPTRPRVTSVRRTRLMSFTSFRSRLRCAQSTAPV